MPEGFTVLCKYNHSGHEKVVYWSDKESDARGYAEYLAPRFPNMLITLLSSDDGAEFWNRLG